MHELFDRRLLLVCGKGGVGRTTVAASMAVAAARAGKRTLLFQANGRGRLPRLLGVDCVDTEIRTGDPNLPLEVVNTHPDAALEEYGIMVLRFRRIYRLVFDNRFTRTFIRTIPGVEDYSLIGKAWYHTTEELGGRPRWDLIVFDMPASGHALSMLRVPRVIVETVPEGPLTTKARLLRELLLDPAQLATVVVTLPEEMPTNESIELAARLRAELGHPVDGLVINQIYPSYLAAEAIEPTVTGLRQAQDPVCARVAADAALHHQRADLHQRYIERLEREFSCQRLQLPYLFTEEPFARAELDTLSTYFQGSP